ncbi:MAG: methyltransferase domain-containing protein [Gemmatimonadales bacterium]
MLLTPPRRRGIEILDDPSVDPDVMNRSMRDVTRANVLFGGRRAAIAELRPALEGLGGSALLLDVGTGRGDIPAAAKKMARSAGIELRTIGIDMSHPLLSANRASNDAVLRGDALRLPFRDSSVDIVMASQILHHFAADAAVAMVREMDRVARRRVVIADLRRSVIAVAGLWLGSFPLRFHPVSRHDGVVSVMRGFTDSELAEIVEAATGRRPVVHRRLGFRLTTSWAPAR